MCETEEFNYEPDALHLGLDEQQAHTCYRILNIAKYLYDTTTQDKVESYENAIQICILIEKEHFRNSLRQDNYMALKLGQTILKEIRSLRVEVAECKCNIR